MQKSQELEKVGSWLTEATDYVKNNLGMIIRVVGWAMLMYLGIVILMAIVFGLGVALFGAMEIGWNVLTGILAFAAAVTMIAILFSIVGKMIIMELMVVDGPIQSARKLWRQIGWKSGLAMYATVLAMTFAIYSGAVLLIVPAFIFGTWFCLAMYIKMDRKTGALESMMLSRDYVKGYGWSIFGRWMLAGLLLMIIFIFMTFLYEWMATQNSILALVGYVGIIVMEIIMGAWIMRLGNQLYQNLVKIKGEIPLKVSGLRRARYIAILTGPFILGILVAIVLVAVNPSAQFEKAREIQESQEALMNVELEK